MKFCISFGKFELKFIIYSFLIVILELYIYRFIDYIKVEILNKNMLLNTSCLFLGYLLNIIPDLISSIKSKEKEKENPIANKLKERNTLSIEYIYNKQNEKQLSSKDILKFGFIYLIPLLEVLIEGIIYIINNIDKKNYDDDFPFIEYIIIFLASKFDKEVYYKHQYISFFLLILAEAIKNIYFIFKAKHYNNPFIIKIVLYIIYSTLYPIYYINIKKLMKYKFISPAKCNFMVGIINFPLSILLYFIISFTSLGNIESNYYYDSVFELFTNLGQISAKSWIILISLPFVYGILEFININTIYNYTIYHIYIPIIIFYFIQNIFDESDLFGKYFLISVFLIELIMILIFLEIIEINCCGLNKNLKRYIQLRGIVESPLTIGIDDDDNETNITKKSNF